MSTLDQHITARRDTDLLARVIAAAERDGMPQPQAWAEANMGAIVAVDLGDTTLTDVHAYAVASYEPTPAPGADASKVTDALIIAAVAAVRGTTTEE